MTTRPSKKRKPISYVPTDASELYPSEDGKPMAVSDYHRKLLIWVLQALEEAAQLRAELARLQAHRE